MGKEPLLYGGFLLGAIQTLIVNVYNVQCQSQLVFAGTGNRNNLSRFYLRLRLRKSLGKKFPHLVLKQPRLIFPSAIRRTYHRRESRRPAIVYHVLQISIAPPIHRVVIHQLRQSDFIILRQQIPLVYQPQIPCIGIRLCRRHIRCLPLIPSRRHGCFFRRIRQCGILRQCPARCKAAVKKRGGTKQENHRHITLSSFPAPYRAFSILFYSSFPLHSIYLPVCLKCCNCNPRITGNVIFFASIRHPLFYILKIMQSGCRITWISQVSVSPSSPKVNAKVNQELPSLCDRSLTVKVEIP